MSKELLYVVDEHDNEVGKATLSEIIKNSLITRAASIIVTNNQEKIFVHQRSKKFRLFPGYFDVKVGGFVTYGESYYEAAIRELNEELGINVSIDYLFSSKTRIKDIKVNREVYKAFHDGPFSFDDKEIENGSFLSMAEIEELLKQKKLSPPGEEVFLGYKKYLEAGEERR